MLSLFAVAAVVGAGLAVGVSGALASSPCGSSGVYSTSGATATCTYSYTGGEDTFAVPAGVGSLDVTAVGAQGGGGEWFAGSNNGGLGAQVTNTALAVTHGATLWVDVGQAGGNFPDGGSGGYNRYYGFTGSGGGSSSLLTTSRSSASLTGNPATDSRLLVAGGGGGAAATSNLNSAAGNAGDTVVTGAGAGGCGGGGGDGGTGPTDGTNGGGGGGCSSSAGTPASGGSGGTYGGGGGGGWFGGGGGYGGGGGSSCGGAAPSPSDISISTASSSQAAEVVISWTLKSTKLTAAPQLVLFEPFVGVGSQLVQATLSSAGSPLAGQTIAFTDGSTPLCSATTNARGIARCAISPQAQLLLNRNNHYTATFAGTSVYAGSTSTVPAVAFLW